MSEPAKTWAWWAVSILWCLGCAVTGVCLKGGCSSAGVNQWVDPGSPTIKVTNEAVRYIWVDGSPTNITIKGVTFLGPGGWTGSVVVIQPPGTNTLKK